jgi:hypothetical protein
MYNFSEGVEPYMHRTFNQKELFQCVNRGSIIAIALLFTFIFLNTMPQVVPTTFVRNIAFAGGNKGHFNADDFKIKKFGIGTDGNPFLTVEGNAGESTPQKADTGLAYVFETNNGTYAATSDWMYTKWHAHELTLDDKNCVKSMNMRSGVGVEIGDDVKITNSSATKLKNVMTAEFAIDNKDGSICANQIFDSAPK